MIDADAPDSVVLRPWRVADTRALFEAVVETSAELRPWMSWYTTAYCEAEARGFIEGSIAARAVGQAYEFAVLDAGERICGACGLNRIDGSNKLANLGYWIRSSRAGRGLATAAVLLLRDWAFAHTDLLRLEIVVDKDNVVSQRVAEKAGGQREGLLRKRLLVHGQARDAFLYALLRPDGAG